MVEIRLDECEAIPTLGFFGGGTNKLRLILSDLQSDVAKIAVQVISESEYEEATKQLGEYSWFKRWVPVKIEGQTLLVNVRSAAKRLGVEKEVVFQEAKQGHFSELLEKESGLLFQKGYEGEDAKGITERISLNKYSWVHEAAGKGRIEKVLQALHVIIDRDGSIQVKQKHFYTYFKSGTKMQTQAIPPKELKDKLYEQDLLQKLKGKRGIIQDVSLTQSKDSAFVNRPFFEKGTLQQSLSSLTRYQRFQVALDLAKALEALKETNIRHGSISLDSIYIDDKGRAFLSDFKKEGSADDEEAIKEILSQLLDHKTEPNFDKILSSYQLEFPGADFIEKNKEELIQKAKSTNFGIYLHRLDDKKCIAFHEDGQIVIHEVIEKEDEYFFKKHHYQTGEEEVIKTLFEATEFYPWQFIESHKALLCKRAKNRPYEAVYVRGNKKYTVGMQFNADGQIYIHKIKNDIAEGSFKRVRLAEIYATGEEIIVARPHKEHEGPLAIEEYKKEISFLKRLKGKEGIAQYIQLIQVDGKRKGKVFYIQPNYSGGTLNHPKVKRLNNNQKIGIARNLLQGLIEMEKEGIIHRDIKPANIFLKEEKGEVKAFFADFGIATDVKDEEEKKYKAGSPAYMAPEYKATNEEDFDSVSRATSGALDVYALGKSFQSLGFDDRQFQELILRMTETNPQNRIKPKEALDLLNSIAVD